jgi:PAS domain S-box-containing protein
MRIVGKQQRKPLPRLFMGASIATFVMGVIFFSLLMYTILTLIKWLPPSETISMNVFVILCIIMFFVNLLIVIFGLIIFHRFIRRQQTVINDRDLKLIKSARDLEIQLATRTMQLRDTETKLQVVVNAAPVILWTLDARGFFTLSEGSGLRQLGLRPNEVVGRNISDVYADHPDIIDCNRRAIAGETLTTKIKLGNMTFLSRYSPLVDAGGNFTGCIGVALDVTVSEQAAEKIGRSQAQLLELVDFLPEGILVMSDGIIKYANRELLNLFRVKNPADVIGRSILDFVHDDSRTIVEERQRRLELGEAVPKLHERLARRDGSIIEAEVLSRPFLFGSEPGAVAVIRDMTERLKSEESLRHTADLLKSVVDGSPIATVGLDLNQCVTIWNRSAEKLFGWSAREVMGKKNPLVTDHSNIYKGVITRLQNKQPVAEFNSRCRHKNGSLILCRTWPAPIKRGDQIIGFFAILIEAEKI